MSLRNSCQRVGSHVRLEIERGLGLAPATLVGRALDVHARPSGRVDFLDQLDLKALEEAMQLLDVDLVKAELSCGDRDLGVSEHADLLAACDQTLDLFKLLKLRY